MEQWTWNCREESSRKIEEIEVAGLSDQLDLVAEMEEIWEDSNVYSLRDWADHISTNKNGGKIVSGGPWCKDLTR